MDTQDGVANIAMPDVGTDQNEKKRPLTSKDEPQPDTKRLKAGSSEENGTGSQNGSADTEVENEIKTGEPAAKVLPKGTAPVKAEYDLAKRLKSRLRIFTDPVRRYILRVSNQAVQGDVEIDDDAAEAKTTDSGDRGQGSGKKNKRKGGANEKRDFGHSHDTKGLCNSRAFKNEFSPEECKYGDRCKLHHNLREYLAEGRRPDLEVLGGKCPVFEAHGYCPVGWKCLFSKSHSEEITHQDGRKELVLLFGKKREKSKATQDEDGFPGVVNNVSTDKKILLSRKRADFSKSQKYVDWLEKDVQLTRQYFHQKASEGVASKTNEEKLADYRAAFVEPPFKPSEKRRLYFDRETPVLAPLTTQGNLPFRRLCVELGAGATYSEMAVGMHVIQGQKSEWALLKAHETEAMPPKYNPENAIPDYNNTKDLKFGAQIAANQPWIALKTTQALTEFLPHLRLVDLNCGCPIDMVFKQGAGSALLDAPTKLERMLRGMNAVSGEVPITCKLRLGVKDGKPTAQRTIERLAFGDSEASNVLGPPGCAAITLHGRSRQQRYRSLADWGYIADCAAMIKSYKEKDDELADTIREPDASLLPNGGKMYFLGNGDCYSHVDYFDHIDNARVDTVMVARGALIKPWIFEEIEKGQYLDKSATERLRYIEKFARYGIECWGSDEMGIGATRKFLLEYLSFTHRYVPIGLLEHLPPKINDRPPAYRGRDDLETLLASNNYKDWIKIRYVISLFS